MNPFASHFGGAWVDAVSRIDCVRRFTRQQCYEALKLPDLQKTVRAAIQRRLRKLERPA